MTLDTVTLRAAFALVALIMLVMFYSLTFRSTRAAYCAWWCVALAMFLLGSCGYLLNGTSQQVWANPLANALLVLGVACAWAGAQTLRGPAPRMWRIVLLPVLTGVLSLFDNPATNVWAGGYIFLFSMSLMFGLTAVVLWRLERSYTRVQLSLAIVAGLGCFYYACRWLVYLEQGPNGHEFETYFGTQITTLFNIILLISVSFSMSALSNEQFTKELSNRATRDGLTGLLNRAEFLRLTALHLRALKASSAPASIVFADLDHFKAINDDYGHSAGDHVLEQFAAACSGAVRSSDLVARFGGEEFVLFLPRTTPQRAETIAETINAQLRETPMAAEAPQITVSYGIVEVSAGTNLDQAIAAADEALYEAKRRGRNRIVHGGEDPVRP